MKMKEFFGRLLIVLFPFTFLVFHPTFGVISDESLPDFLGPWRVYGLCMFLLIAGGFVFCQNRWWSVASLLSALIFILWTL